MFADASDGTAGKGGHPPCACTAGHEALLIISTNDNLGFGSDVCKGGLRLVPVDPTGSQAVRQPPGAFTAAPESTGRSNAGHWAPSQSIEGWTAHRIHMQVQRGDLPQQCRPFGFRGSTSTCRSRGGAAAAVQTLWLLWQHLYMQVQRGGCCRSADPLASISAPPHAGPEGGLPPQCRPSGFYGSTSTCRSEGFLPKQPDTSQAPVVIQKS